MVAIFILILVACVVFSVVLTARSQNKQLATVLVVSWMGSILALTSFFLLPWIKLGNPGTIQQNAQWIAKQTEVINIIKKLPGLDEWLKGITDLTANEVLDALKSPIKNEFFQLAESGKPFTGLVMVRFLFSTSPIVGVLFLFNQAVAIISSLVSLIFMLKQTSSRPVSIGLVAATGIGFVGVITAIPSLDTFCVTSDAASRIITVMAQSTVSYGGGVHAIGLLTIAIANLIIVRASNGIGMADDE